MTEYKPQDLPGFYRRLDFEQIGGDDFSRYVRTQKGIIREIVTPKYSVPLSREGTKLHEYTDRNEVTAAVLARDALIRLVVLWYPVVKFERALLSYITNHTIIKELIQTKFLCDSAAVSPEVFTNG